MKREYIWFRAYIAYISSSNAVDKYAGASWADVCLKAYDDRFGPTPGGKEKEGKGK